MLELLGTQSGIALSIGGSSFSRGTRILLDGGVSSGLVVERTVESLTLNTGQYRKGPCRSCISAGNSSCISWFTAIARHDHISGWRNVLPHHCRLTNLDHPNPSPCSAISPIARTSNSNRIQRNFRWNAGSPDFRTGRQTFDGIARFEYQRCVGPKDPFGLRIVDFDFRLAAHPAANRYRLP